MADDEQRWALLLREALADDALWAAHVRTLSPRTPLRDAVADYVRAISEKLALTPGEVRAAERVLAAMERGGFMTPDEFFDAVEQGEVTLEGEPMRRSRSRGRKLPDLEPRGI